MTTQPVSTARSVGHATIMFGLVSIPVKLYTTTESDGGISFNMLHDKDHARLKQQYVCTVCGEVVDKDHTVKGYEHAKGAFVTFTTAELDALDAISKEQIEIAEFVPSESLDALYVEKSYYLGPDKGADRGYQLLADALLGTGMIGIGRWSARGKEHVVAIRPMHDGLAIVQLRYASEVKSWEAVPPRLEARVSNAELRLAKDIVRQLSSSDLDIEKYTDRVQERRRALIAAKVESGEEIVAPTPEQPAPAPIDLVESLKASLDVAKASGPEKRTPKTRARVAAKKKRAA